MHFATLALFLVATGLSASASPRPAALAAPAPVAAPIPAPVPAPLPQDLSHFKARGHTGSRRLSRKMHLAARHGGHHHHHHHTTVTAFTTITSGSADPTPTGDAPGTTTVPVFTTITSGLAEPTSSSSTDDGSSSTSEPAPSSTSGTAPPSSSGAVIVATGSPCGDPNGTADPSKTGGPNGEENWLNCGVDGNGWIPPPITLENLVYKDLAEVLKQDGNPFAACGDYLPTFESMSAETGVPTIFLASIALQESGCNPSVTGGAGEIGMMQITDEKCPIPHNAHGDGSDGSDCYDAATNIAIGARYFKKVLDDNNGNLAAAMGNYNGWYTGLTVALANNYAICAQHNNLDYLQNVFNGYCQGVDPSSLQMGIYHNTC